MSYDSYPTSTQNWTFRLADTDTFDDIVELPNARSRQLELYLNKPGSLTFSVNLEDSNSTLIEPIKTCVKAYRNGEMAWSGMVWSVNDSSDGLTQVSCIGWLEYLNHRITYEDYEYTNTDAGAIAFDLLDKSYLWADTKYYSAEFDDCTYNTTGIGAPIISDEINTGSQIKFTLEGGYLGNGSITPLIKLNNVLERGKKYDITISVVDKYNRPENSTIDIDSIQVLDTNIFPINMSIVYDFQSTTGTTGDDSSPLVHNSNFILDLSAIDQQTYSSYGKIINLNNPTFLYFKHSFGFYYGVSLKYEYTITIKEQEKIYDIPITAGSYEQTQIRTKSYTKYSNVGQEITNLSEIEAGYDLEIDSSTRQLNIYDRIGQEMNIVFGYNFGPNNLKNISVNQDPSRMTNKFTALGQSQAITADENTSQDEYGIFAETGSASNVSEQAILGAYANAEVALRNTPIVTYDFQPLPTGADSVPEPFTDYNVGDTVYLSAKKGRINIDNQAVRIFGMTINIDDNNLETVTAIKTQAN